LEKIGQILGEFQNGGRKCMSILDFCFFYPVIQLPIFILGGGSAAAFLMQHSIKFISESFGNSIILMEHSISVFRKNQFNLAKRAKSHTSTRQ
jgi:hypothetical protein